jgi:ABC-type glycerol-3-phosphate transport system substrate-binding protein
MEPKNNKRPEILWVVLLSILMALALSGCGLASTPTPEPVTLIFSFPEVDNDFYEPLAPVFNEEFPNITIELNPLRGNALGNLDPDQTDVIAVDVFDLRDLQRDGGILGLNSVIEKDDSFNMSDYLPGTVDFLAVDGETWAVPVGADLGVMYYNKDLFDQHSLPYPQLGWDWDDFLTYALTVNDPESVLEKIYGYTGTPGYQDVYYFIYQHGGRLFNDVFAPTEAAFNDPLTVEAVEFYADLFHLHGVAPTPADARRAYGGSQYAAMNAIRTGNIGMWSLSISQRGGYGWGVEWYVNWGVAPLPRDAEQFAPFWVQEGYAISSGTGSPDECWQWITFLTQQINPRLVPTRRSLIESDAYGQIVGEEVAAVVRQSLDFAVPISLWQWINLGNAIDTFNDAIEDVVEGRSTPQEALDWAQERAESQMP